MGSSRVREGGRACRRSCRCGLKSGNHHQGRQYESHGCLPSLKSSSRPMPGSNFQLMQCPNACHKKSPCKVRVMPCEGSRSHLSVPVCRIETLRFPLLTPRPSAVSWIPAFAGMTIFLCVGRFLVCVQSGSVTAPHAAPRATHPRQKEGRLSPAFLFDN